jgi:type II secretory pathway predicted ATPase ExeA
MSKRQPTRQQIERRAFEIYVERGCQEGDNMADWVTAEKELAELDGHDQAVGPSSLDHHRGATQALLDFYGLREQPFGVTPDPAFLYASRTHSAALESLAFAIRDDRGFLALIAEPGMGKTTLLNRLLDDLRDSARMVFVFQTYCDSHELFQYILQDLNVDVRGMDLVAMHTKLNELLLNEMFARRRCVLVVDEAQNLDESVLETLRMLSNFETPHAKLLQIVLSGQPELATKLAQPRLYQLRQRISLLSHLQPLSPTETVCYIEHRLKVAGRRELLFVPAALDLIAQHSRGIPRNINNICYNALLAGYGKGVRIVSASTVREAVARLDLESPSSGLRLTADPDAGPRISMPEPSPATGSASGDDKTGSQLTYEPVSRTCLPRWPFRAAALVGVLLLGSLLPVILERAGPTQTKASTTSDVHWASRSQSTARTYAADPQDIGDSQVLTVVVGSHQTLKDLSLLYAGHFDPDQFQEICNLNPELRDPDHLEAGQLIRMPLPPGTLKKENDTAETVGVLKLNTLKSALSRMIAQWRGKRQ